MYKSSLSWQSSYRSSLFHLISYFQDRVAGPSQFFSLMCHGLKPRVAFMICGVVASIRAFSLNWFALCQIPQFVEWENGCF